MLAFFSWFLKYSTNWLSLLFFLLCHLLIQVFITSAKDPFFLPSEKDGLVRGPTAYKLFPFTSGPSSLAWLTFRSYYKLSEPLLKGLLLVYLCLSTWASLEIAFSKE